MLFLDGVGIGSSDPAKNPVAAARLPALRSLLEGEIPVAGRTSVWTAAATLLPLDATLGVGGLPQSGTGQTALFTGENAARLVGKHYGPHPYSTLRPVIQERSIFRRLLDMKRQPYFANAFPQKFFDYARRNGSRLTVTTLACQMSGIPLLHSEHLLRGLAVSADITGAGWRELGYPDMPVIEPPEAGRRLAALSTENDFVLFEYWKTDHAGHSDDFDLAVSVLETFDAMLGGIIEAADLRSTLVVLTSDHGNLEDMSTKTHTRNPVPFLLLGRGHAQLARRLQSMAPAGADLTHVTPLLLGFLGENGSG
jgi:hypothetical protein